MKAFNSALFLGIILGVLATVSVSRKMDRNPGYHGKNGVSHGNNSGLRNFHKPRESVGKCPEKDGRYPVFLPDSEDCHKYYKCNEGKPSEKFCDGDYVWHPDLDECVPKEEYECTSNPVSTGCNEGDFFENPSDCNTFFQCNSEGKQECRLCPLGTVWNQESGKCDFLHNVARCQHLTESEQANQVCNLTGECHIQLFANPNNCSTFYQCDNGIAKLKDCPLGTVFSRKSGICDSGTECPTSKCEPVPVCTWVGEGEYETLYYPCIEDPTKYFECVFDLPDLRDCGDGTFWSDENKPCGGSWDRSQNKNSTLNQPSGFQKRTTEG